MKRREFVRRVGAIGAVAGFTAVAHSAERVSDVGDAQSDPAKSSPPKVQRTRSDYRAMVDRIRGPLVPITPAFTDSEQLDLDSTQRWLSWIVQGGIPLVWLTYGTSRYFALSDREVLDLTKAVGEVTRGRSIFFAATNVHWPIHQCRRYLKYAADCGADVVKVQCNWYINPSEDAVFDYCRAVAEDSPLPLFAYTLSPGKTSGMSNSLLKRILDLPQFVGMKNDSGDFYVHRKYLATIREHGAKFTPMTGGSMMSFLWGYDFGAQAFASGYGMIDPKTPLAFYRHLVAGQREQALAIVRNREEHMLAALADYGGWTALRSGLVDKGLFASRQERFPLPTLTPKQAEHVKEYLRQQGLI